MSYSDISPVPDRTPSEPDSESASADNPTGNLSSEGGHCPGDSSPESPLRDVFALDGSCMGEFSIFPIESQSYIEMHTTPDFPKYEASISSDLAQLQSSAAACTQAWCDLKMQFMSRVVGCIGSHAQHDHVVYESPVLGRSNSISIDHIMLLTSFVKFPQ